jgi:hypothetical protein
MDFSIAHKKSWHNSFPLSTGAASMLCPSPGPISISIAAGEVEESQSCAICHARLPHPRKGSVLSQPKRLPCGHIFHFSCLRDWLFHSESCPMCRQSLSDCMTPSLSTDWRYSVISAIDSWFTWPFNHVDKVLFSTTVR